MNISNLVEDYQLDEYRQFLVEHARDCVRSFAERQKDDDIPVGASKYGGAPDVPVDFEWPQIQPYPMTHLAQINCAEVALVLRTELIPQTGILHFFIQVDEEGYLEFPDDGGNTWIVVHNDIDSLVRTEPPDDSEFHYDARMLSFRRGFSLPDPFSDVVEELQFNDGEAKRFLDLYEELGGHEDQLFGYPAIIQPTDFGDSQLILQVLSDQDDFMFGDCGYLYFTNGPTNELDDIKLQVAF